VQSKKFPEFYFSNVLQIQNLYDREKLETHTPVWVVWSGQMQNFVTEHQAKIKEIPLEVRVDFQGNSDLVFYDRVESQNFEFAKVKTFIRTTPGRVCFHDYLVTTVFAPQ
jgi:hypothetical protein